MKLMSTFMRHDQSYNNFIIGSIARWKVGVKDAMSLSSSSTNVFQELEL
mgnify:CR=1 FL=1